MTDPGSRINYQGQPLSSVNVPQSVRLNSGAVWNMPGGSFVVNVPAQCAVQWFDSFAGLWHTFASGPSNHPISVVSDGTNFRLINLSGTIVGATVTAAGSAYTQAGTTISFAAPSTGITATATPIIGGSLSFTVATAGTGYTNPYLIIPAPQLLGGTVGQCIPAVVALNLSTGTIGSITSSFAGAGYLTAPGATVQTITPAVFAANPQVFLNGTNMVIVDPAGSGASITSAITNGTPASGGLTGLIMTNNGSGYAGTTIPAITITGPGTSATATALPSLALTSVTVAGTNTGYTATIIFESSLGASASPPLAVFGEPVLARAARGTIAQSGGVLGTATIEDNGASFQTVPIIRQVGNATVDGSVNATFTAVVGGVTNTALYWQVG